MSVWEELVSAYKDSMIEFPHLKPVTLAQWILESGRGDSDLAKRHLNFGGLKWRAEMEGIAQPIEYEAHDGRDQYCKFKTVQDFIAGYWKFIDRSPYRGWRAHSSSGSEYIRFIGPIYTPSATYSNKVLDLLAEAEELLGNGDSLDIERPSVSISGTQIDPPVIHRLNDVKHVIRGRRPNGLEGMIVHYDAFRIQADSRNSVDDRAKQMLVLGQQNKYCYGTISRSGKIYMPGNVDWLDWGSHAGESLCPVTNRPAVSQYYIGWEVNCPGVVYEDEVEKVFFAWFNTKVDQDGNPVLRNGRRQIRSMSDEHYQPHDVRYCEKQANIQSGFYVPYTKAQFDALVSLIRFYCSEYPTTFSIDKVLGHDEVSPGRKSDPGGALAYEGKIMTMPEFRDYVKSVL